MVDSTLRNAIELHRNGQVEVALPLYAKVLSEEPGNLAALFYGGVSAWTARQFELALQRLNRAIALAPTPVADAYFHRALVFTSLQQTSEAIADYQRCIKLKPNFAQACNNLALLLRDQGDLIAAANHLDSAIAANPQFHDARYNRGLVAAQMGQAALARTVFAECLKREPENVAVRASLVDILIDCAAQSEALALARASVKRLPKEPLLWNALAQAESAAGNDDATAMAYTSGLRVAPDHPVLSLNAALFESEHARFDSASNLYCRLINTHQHDGARFRLATLLPTIPESEAQIDQMRSSFCDQLRRLQDSQAKLSDPLNEFGDTPFYLSYHGRHDDKDLLGQLEETLRAACPALNFTAPHIDTKRRAGKPRIGFCSHFLFDQSVGRAVHAYIKALVADDFAVTLLQVPPFFSDALSRQLSENTTVLELPFDLRSARERIAALELDLLIFPEIGMDALTYYLALSRLAPVQWTTLGHPCTSGLANIDGYLSYAALEPPGSQRFYSEKVIQIPEGAIYPDYPAPSLPKRLRNRAELGFSGNEPLLICPQSLFKLMPQFDDVLHRILQERPTARVLLPQAKHSGQVSALSQRFEKKMGALAQRIVYFPRRSRSEFVELVAACDVMLDPFPVSGGITTWDALITGIPMVTWPQELMRSRLAYSALAQMDAKSTVAHDMQSYAETTLRLINDESERASIRSKIASEVDLVFQDRRAVPHFVAAVRVALNH